LIFNQIVQKITNRLLFFQRKRGQGCFNLFNANDLMFADFMNFFKLRLSQECLPPPNRQLARARHLCSATG
jgi:hypothetical protein